MVICRECGAELVVGENWYKSYAKRNDHICIKCKKAYARQRYKDNPDYERPKIICQECGEEKPHHAHGLCETCYQRQYQRQCQYKRPTITCKECGKEKSHAARGLCDACYYQEHREERLAYQRQWQKENRDKARAKNLRYLARKKGATIEPVDEAKIYERYGNRCFYCDSKENLTLDHVVPLNGGGAHCEDNLVVACRSCNCSKNDRSLIEWLQTQPRARAWVM